MPKKKKKGFDFVQHCNGNDDLSEPEFTHTKGTKLIKTKRCRYNTISDTDTEAGIVLPSWKEEIRTKAECFMYVMPVPHPDTFLPLRLLSPVACILPHITSVKISPLWMAPHKHPKDFPKTVYLVPRPTTVSVFHLTWIL